MKILYVQPYVTFSGVLNDTLPGQLAKKGHDVLIASYFKNPCAIESRRKNLRFYPVKALSFSIPNMIAEFPLFLSFDDVIDNFRPDVIHVNNLPFLTTYQAISSSKYPQIPRVLQVHGVTAERGFLLNLSQIFFLRLFGKKVFKGCSKVIALTHSDAHQLERYGCPKSKICIIPNGVDTNSFKPIKHEPNGLIVWIGRFVPEKGLQYLIEAINYMVKKNVSNFRLLLIGDGPQKPHMRSLIQKYKLEKYITLQPAIDHDKVSYFLGNASIFVLPSLKEGMPYSLLEAMSSGTAVVGTDISGVNDLIVHGQNGLLVPVKDPCALADAIMILLTDKNLRERLGNAARNHIIESFSWDVIIKKVEALYTECI